MFEHLERSDIFDVAKPYLVSVTPRSLIYKSLNETLQDLKADCRASEDARRACAKIVAEAQRELREQGGVGDYF